MTRADWTELADTTQAVHAGNALDGGSGAIRTPIVMANSYALPDDPSTMSWSGTESPLYTRNSGANQIGLQRKLAVLEHGEDSVVLASGVAALHAVFFTFLRSGDHVIVSDVSYEATYRLFTELFPEKYGIEADFVDTSDLDAVRAALRPHTRLVHIEAIANPTTKADDRLCHRLYGDDVCAALGRAVLHLLGLALRQNRTALDHDGGICARGRLVLAGVHLARRVQLGTGGDGEGGKALPAVPALLAGRGRLRPTGGRSHPRPGLPASVTLRPFTLHYPIHATVAAVQPSGPEWLLSLCLTPPC